MTIFIICCPSILTHVLQINLIPVTLRLHVNGSRFPSSLLESRAATPLPQMHPLIYCQRVGRRRETTALAPAKSWRPLPAVSAVIWVAAFTGWNLSTGFRFSDSFLKLPSLSLSSCFHPCSSVQSACLQLMNVLAAASFHPAELLGFVCHFSCPVLKLSVPAAPLCVCYRVKLG